MTRRGRGFKLGVVTSRRRIPSYALVGALGAPSSGGLGVSITPAWGTGESRTAGNLLICWAGTVFTSGTAIATPSGWTQAVNVTDAAGTTASIFYKIAAGGDTAPTLAGVSGEASQAMLGEFSGNAVSTPLDRTATAHGNASSFTATAAGADATTGELVITAAVMGYSPNGAISSSHAVNNVVSMTSVNNNAAVVGTHYNFAWGISNANASADSDVFSVTAANQGAHCCVVMASFKHG